MDIYEAMEILGVSSRNKKEIKDKFRLLVMKFHPDKNEKCDKENIMSILEAYKTLCDKENIINDDWARNWKETLFWRKFMDEGEIFIKKNNKMLDKK